jgi:urate oxidase
VARLAWDGYGKAAVHLSKVERNGARHTIRHLSVDVRLEGDFGPAHTDGENAAVLPTDTMKNTVYALARQGPVDPPEAFGERLGRHYLSACPAARKAVITVAAHRWDRAEVDGRAHDHAFLRGPAERRLATVTVERGAAHVEAGLADLGLLKTTRSGFAGFLRDRYTTLRETDDRIFATAVTARWTYARPPQDFTAAWDAVRAALIRTFGGHDSRSVQHTLYAMGEAALAACAEMVEIRLVLPNQHHLLVDLAPFGLDNPNEVFQVTSEPYGLIEAVVTR